jgi:copper homeostasis protein (lipoprotein)
MKNLSLSLILLFVLRVLSGCTATTPSVQDKTAATTPVHPFPLPSTYTGTIPYPDYDSMDLILTLRTDGLYIVKKTRKKGKEWDASLEMGRWKYEPAEKALVLGRRRGSLATLVFTDSTQKTLRLQDMEGKKLAENGNYILKRNATVDNLADPVKMRGMFAIKEDRPLFSECMSGHKFPVAREKAYRKLEQAYDTTPHGQGEGLLVAVEGSFDSRPSEENPDREVLLVHRFLRIFPEQNCQGQQSKTTLFDHTWVPVELLGKPVELAPGQKEPFLILEKKNNRMHGFSGCNRFFGTYFLRGGIFVFNKVAATRMACMKGLNLEDAFLDAMRKTEAYATTDDGTLELRDRNGTLLARFKAVK